MVELAYDVPGQVAEILGRPDARRAVGAAGVEEDAAAVAAQAQSFPNGIGRFLFAGGGGQFQAGRFIAATQRVGEGQIGVDDGFRDEASIGAVRMKPIGQEASARVSSVAYALSCAGPPCHKRGAEGICKQDGQVEAFLAEAVGDRPGAVRAIVAARVEEPLLVEPICAGEDFGEIGAEYAHQAGVFSELPPQRPEHWRSHDQVAQPIGQENSGLHKYGKVRKK